MRGKLIVIEGGDGAGKATQTKKLVERLEAEGHKVKLISFPQYDTASAAMVEAYLRGDFGPKENFSPYAASVLYAHDRFEARDRLEEWLASGTVVVADRYVTSNRAHQGARIDDPKERKIFLEWLDDLEHVKLGLPRPDIVIILEAEAKLRDINVGKKDARNYLRGQKKDIHEGDLPYQQRVDRVYHELTISQADHVRVNCMDDEGNLLPMDVCHGKIWSLVEKVVSKNYA